MPTEKYVEKKFSEGMAFERWLETSLHTLQDVKVVKRTDVSEKPHKYEEIKDVPSDPDMNVTFTDNQRIKIWVTHKKISPSLWKSKGSEYKKAMFWRWKSYKFMNEGDYLIYGIFNPSSNINAGADPYEVLFMKYTKGLYKGSWSDRTKQDQDDLRAKIDMSASEIIYNSSGLTISGLLDIL